MKFSLCSISLIAICTLPKIYSKTPKVPGCAGCTFFGTTTKYCGEVIPAAKLPPECESLFYYGIRTNETLEIIDATDEGPNIGFIVDVDSVGKPFYLYYGRRTTLWMEYLECISQNGGVNTTTEMINLKKYLNQFKNIAGLILNNLSIDPETQVIPDLTVKFKQYLDEIKKTFPNYSFGIEIIGRQFVDLYKSSKLSQWFDFKVLDPCIDFYILDLYYFNDCTPDFKVGGSSPISGNKGRTLDQLVAAAKKANIPQSKTYFSFKSGGTQIDGGSVCDSTSTQLCKKKSLDGFCSDNTQTFYDKGKFAKTYGVGFVMINTDVSDDPNGVCQCETPYPAFHDVLAGFKGLSVPKPCPLLDKC